MVDEKCDGQSQSPIDIAKSASLNQSLTKVELASSWDTSSLGSSTKFKLVNKGYTVQLTIDSNVEITSTQSGKTFHRLLHSKSLPLRIFLETGGSRSVHNL